ncbi:HNH endonuclease signature motif containing protein [Rhizobium mongolense]|uniref:HNH endonuclease signature motif containing protein n=1 Tax=Rhizobium mongolense TaxID=57676 RepID=UPI0034A45065
MWAVEKPGFDTGKTFDDCAALIKNAALRANMTAIRQNILNMSSDYDARGELAELHLIAQHQGVANVEASDLKKNYTSRMARKGVPARAVYDALKILPKNNRCPYCNYGSVETLDHVLTKDLYPAFSVAPINLVGCCDRCNRLKGEAAPTGPNDGYLHPYFDRVNHAVWLVAEVAHSTPAAATFRAENLSGLDGALFSRIQTQFDGLELARLYSDAASDEIVDIADVLEEVFQSGGAEAVAAHLERQRESRRQANLNSWRAALYDALAASNWYCDGGFRLGGAN